MALKGLLVLTVLATAYPVPGQEEAQHNLMPAPAEISFGKDRLIVDATFQAKLIGYSEPRLEKAIRRLKQRITAQTGILFLDDPGIEGSGTTLFIRVERTGEKIQTIKEDESYSLKVSAQGAFIKSATPVGALRGMETLIQLIEPGPSGFETPFVSIVDRPRFPWRGLLIDSCRHWLPPEVIYRTLDAMAAVKLNVLHWHLSEDQGFRVECKAFPRLHQMGSDGNYYSHETLRKIVAFARERGIRVVPEFDMPGHTTSWLVGYPELASAPGPYKISRRWGVHEPVFDPTRDEVYQFINKFIKEMTTLFPDEYFHIGGDEVKDKHWQNNPAIQKFMSSNGIADSAELQAYFNRRVQKILSKYGKKMIGWDEILHTDLPKDIVVQSWRGQESLAEGAKKGYYGILSNGYYIDLFYHASDHYQVDPLSGAAELSKEEKARILGGEACMWGELITPELIDSRIWPRTAAIAERFWSPGNINDVGDMYRRLEIQSRRLEGIGLNHRSFTRVFLERIVGSGESIDHLLTLASFVEPLKGYKRHRSREYRSYTPMKRFVDAVTSDSKDAREFNRMVVEMLASNEGWKKHKDSVVKILQNIRDNHILLRPQLERNGALKEILPLSSMLSQLAEAGLLAINYKEQGEIPEAGRRDQMIQLLKSVQDGGQQELPKHELQIAIVSGIRAIIMSAINQKAQI